jgi:hypothetical protein
MLQDLLTGPGFNNLLNLIKGSDYDDKKNITKEFVKQLGVMRLEDGSVGDNVLYTNFINIINKLLDEWGSRMK